MKSLKPTPGIKNRMIISVVTGALLFSACGEEKEAELTDAEKDRRQELTFDISGTYYSENGGEHPSVLTVENENKFHDVRATYAIGREFLDTEKEKLRLALTSHEQRMTAQEADVVTYQLRTKLQALALGVGKTFELRGGENIVLDAEGQASEVVLASRKEGFYDVAFSGSRETYSVELTSYYTAVNADKSLAYLVTRNTDKYGQTAEARKGIYIKVSRTVFDSFGQQQQDSEIITMELTTGIFKK